MTPNRWALLAIGIVTAAFIASALLPETTTTRYYWPVPLDTLAIGHRLHTHMEITGRVAPNYPVSESDGDWHIKLLSLVPGSTAFIIVECIPLLPSPCVGVKSGETITVRGIERRDPEHAWYEIHPAESVVIVSN